MKSVRRIFLMVLSNVIVTATCAVAAERPFYQGKNVIFLINFAAGGPTDIEGRIVARHLAKHIAGNPAVIVQNMAGAGGVTGINFLGEAAKRDALGGDPHGLTGRWVASHAGRPIDATEFGEAGDRYVLAGRDGRGDQIGERRQNGIGFFTAHLVAFCELVQQLTAIHLTSIDHGKTAAA